MSSGDPTETSKTEAPMQVEGEKKEEKKTEKKEQTKKNLLHKKKLHQKRDLEKYVKLEHLDIEN